MPKNLTINDISDKPNKKPNYSYYGLTLQKMICEYYKLSINDTAQKYFNSAIKKFDEKHNEDYKNELISIIPKIFEDLKSEPIELLTFTDKFTDPIQSTSPHNFLLKNRKRLSIKTSDKIAPNTVGQAGYERLNYFYGNIYFKEIENRQDIKILMYCKIDEILPSMINNLFQSDYTVLLSQKNPNNYDIIKNDDVDYDSFLRNDFEFSQNPRTWNESTELKYRNETIAQIQVHHNRTPFKFRFYRSKLSHFLQFIKYNNETLGISAEAAICEIFKLEKPDSFSTRAMRKYINNLKPTLREAFNNMPSAIEHSGSTQGERGGQSKCPYDFVLEGNFTLSVKTNIGRMVCPPEVGQPGANTCIMYFSDYLPEGTTEENLKRNFKHMVYNHIHEIIPIYINHLFDSDWLLWVHEERNGYEHQEIHKNQIIWDYVWKKENFTFSKPSIEEWNESNTLYYNDKSLGNFQVHNHRNCYKFRFDMKNLLDIILK